MVLARAHDRMAITWGLVPPDEIGTVWNAVAPLLAKAVEYDDGRRSLDGILNGVLTRDQLWVVCDGPEIIGAVITSLLQYEKQRALKVEWLAGHRFSEWAHLISVLENFAKANGCYGVEIAGRPGLARVYKGFGFEITGFEGRKLVNA